MKKTIVALCVCVMVAGLGVAAEKDGAALVNGAVKANGTQGQTPEATLFVVYDDGT